jgi:hypothetical protein
MSASSITRDTTDGRTVELPEILLRARRLRVFTSQQDRIDGVDCVAVEQVGARLAVPSSARRFDHFVHGLICRPVKLRGGQPEHRAVKGAAL